MRICLSAAGTPCGLRDQHWRKPFACEPDFAEQEIERALMKLTNWKKWMLAALAIVAIAPNSGCKKVVADPFPASGAVAGWQKTTDTRAFAAKDLWQYIDGDSEQYIQAGVISTSTSDYKYQGQLEAVVDVYTMGGADGARTILEKGKTNEAKTVPLGDEGVQYAQSVNF